MSAAQWTRTSRYARSCSRLRKASSAISSISISTTASTTTCGATTAGVVGSVGIAGLYRALAMDQMGIAAPVTAVLSAGIPAVVGVFIKGLPHPAQLAGFVLAICGMWFVSRPAGAVGRPKGFGLALVAGAGIGAAVGGTAGLLAGLGMLAIPGLGPVVAAGWLASTAALALEQVIATAGDWPRNFSLHPSGRWLLVANQRSDSVVVFGRDPENGRLTPMRQRIALSSPVCLRFA